MNINTLIDFNGDVVGLGDIVQRVNLVDNKSTYYLYTQASGNTKLFLFQITKNGEIEKNSLYHIPVDLSTTLCNSNLFRWYKVVEEVK